MVWLKKCGRNPIGFRQWGIHKLKDNMIACYSKGLFTPNGQLFDIGISTRNVIDNMIQGMKIIECGGTSEADNGNGSLMRVLPLAFVRDKYNNQEYIKLIEDVSSVTHGHKRSKLACIIYVLLAFNLYRGWIRKKHSIVQFAWFLMSVVKSTKLN